ncbi:MAG: hypothetical protein SCH98_17920, partial [Deferrisomatales bacterium]|nr:hypothetical protein [Deferrisomatales bacterium]
YSRVEDYRLRVHSVIRRAGEAPEETDLTYWFRRPDRFRMELRNPHPGLTLVHPHGEGRVRVRPGGLLRFLKISLDPGSARLEVSPGQRVDQTDLGLLIRNISRSLAGAAPGAAAVRTEGGTVVLSVEGENHFLPGVWTRYELWVDRELWLPVRVREEVPSRGWERDVRFDEITLNPGLPESFFRLD